MKECYTFEPTKLEIILTRLIGKTLLTGYYSEFVAGLEIQTNDKVLDYCCGGGFISQKIAKKLQKQQGQLVYADVSEKWLKYVAKKTKLYKIAVGSQLRHFNNWIMGGEFDKIVVHYALHDFPLKYRIMVFNQLVKNLKRSGILFIREPIGKKHGIKLYELINLIEATKKLSYQYKITKKFVRGEFVDIRCWLK